LTLQLPNPAPKREPADRPITVSVSWAYDLHDCPMSRRTWNRILAGKPVRRVEPYWYEGKRFIGDWNFNEKKFGSLVVGYEDSGEGFNGTLYDAFIFVDGKRVEWRHIAGDPLNPDILAEQ
jgi:hypothetical protein